MTLHFHMKPPPIQYRDHIGPLYPALGVGHRPYLPTGATESGHYRRLNIPLPGDEGPMAGRGVGVQLTCVNGADNIGAMYTPSSDGQSEPEHIARYLSDVTAAVWTAFDFGRALADSFFEPDHHQHDPHMHAHLVRYGAVLELSKQNTNGEWGYRRLRNSGIEVSKGPFVARVCKATKGNPQSPGRNHARQDFFQQLALPSLLLEGAEPQNLILYWMVIDGELELGLCKPVGLWRFRGQPKLEWRQRLRYDPYEGIGFVPTEQDSGLDIDLDEGDLGEEESG